MKKQVIFAWLLLAASVCLGAVSFFVLPDTVVTQFSAGGSGVTTMPKLVAVLLPLALGVGGSLASLLSKGEGKDKGKPLLIACIGIVVFVLMLIVNL